MSNKHYWVEESYLTSMADVIRNKTGKTDKILFPDGFFDEIINIETTPATALPVLDSNYPEDITVVESANVSANFIVNISIPGVPAEYTYQWYMDGVAINGATNSSWSFNGEKSKGTYNVYCEVKNEAGTITSRISKLIVESYLPEFTYSGTYELIEDGNYNWRIKFLTSGTFTPTKIADNIDVFCVGGGAAGTEWYSDPNAAGGGGGYTTTSLNRITEKGRTYTITIGAGGIAGVSSGGKTSISNELWTVSANGGNGVNGGSGGGLKYAGKGGSDGSNGYTADGSLNGGKGQGTTTREFGESTGTLYAGGGGASNSYNAAGAGGAGGGGRGCNDKAPAVAGTTNTGGGGGGSMYGYSGADHGHAANGGSGIVVIRNHRS